MLRFCSLPDSNPEDLEIYACLQNAAVKHQEKSREQLGWRAVKSVKIGAGAETDEKLYGQVLFSKSLQTLWSPNGTHPTCKLPGLEWKSSFSRSCNKNLIESRHVEIQTNDAGKMHSTVAFTAAAKSVLNKLYRNISSSSSTSNTSSHIRSGD